MIRRDYISIVGAVFPNDDEVDRLRLEAEALMRNMDYIGPLAAGYIPSRC